MRTSTSTQALFSSGMRALGMDAVGQSGGWTESAHSHQEAQASSGRRRRPGEAATPVAAAAGPSAGRPRRPGRQRLQQRLVFVAAGERQRLLVRAAELRQAWAAPRQSPPSSSRYGSAVTAGTRASAPAARARRPAPRRTRGGVLRPARTLGGLLGDAAIPPGQPGVLRAGGGHRPDPLELVGGEGPRGGLLEDVGGLGVAAAGLEPAEHHQGADHPGAALPRSTTPPGRPAPRRPSPPGPAAYGRGSRQVLDVPAEVVSDERDRLVEIRGGVTVVAHIHRDGGD